MEEIKVKYFVEDLEPLTYVADKSDWIDLRAAETVTLQAGEFRLIPLGVAIALPEGYEAHIVPRSSTFRNYGILQTNSMGVVDYSYRGDNDQWHMPAYATRDVTIEKNARICQFRIMKNQASGSPRRRELLTRMGIADFDVRVPETEETYPPNLTPRETVEYISREKARAAAALCRPDEIVITADTMVFLDGARLGKPRDEAHALEMLTALQGRRHTVCTGVTVCRGDYRDTQSEETEVFFRPATEQELRAYIRTGEPMDKAGAYGIQGRGALLVEKIHGDFFNVMGLPVLRLSRMLLPWGVHCLD